MLYSEELISIAMILIHREYLSSFPAKFIIESNQVRTENANRPHGHGMINPSDFTPYPKNPVIARFFKEIGRADELGSGVRNLYKYTRIYSGVVDPQLIEGDIFKIIIPTTPQATEQATEQDISAQLISFCQKARTAKEMMNYPGLKHREHFRSEILKSLIDQVNQFGRFSLDKSPLRHHINIGRFKTPDYGYPVECCCASGLRQLF